MEDGERTGDCNFETLSPEEAFTQLCKWWLGDAPSVELVKALATRAWSYLGAVLADEWAEIDGDYAGIAMGEICRYALCPEPPLSWEDGILVEPPIDWQVWIDQLQPDGLADLFFPGKEEQKDWPIFSFDFCQDTYINRDLYIGRGSMRDWFFNKVAEYGDPTGSAPPLVFGKPPDCVKKLHEAIETYYECLRMAVVEREVDADGMTDALEQCAEIVSSWWWLCRWVGYATSDGGHTTAGLGGV